LHLPQNINIFSIQWFGRVAWSSVRRLEVQKWLYWSIFNKELPELDQIPSEHLQVLDDTLELLEKRLGMRVPAGSNPSALPMRMTLAKVEVSGRPLFYYALIFGINWYLQRRFRIDWNLRHGNYDGLE
jgi:hypothetical protein